MQPALVWFRRDLRLADNPALAAAVAEGRPLVALYVFDEESKGMRAIGAAGRWWLERSLKALGQSLDRKGVKLLLRKGTSARAVREVMEETGAASLHYMRDYAPWSEAVEEEVRETAEGRGAECHRHQGFLLHEPERIRTGSGNPYKVFTPFSRACLKQEPRREPRPAPAKIEAYAGAIRSEKLKDWNLYEGRPDWAADFSTRWTPGEAGARAALKRFIAGALADYAAGRDRPSEKGTSRLSPHLQAGEISPLQCWHAVRSAMGSRGGRQDKSAETFLKELLWREFSYHLIHQFPELPRKPFRPEFANFAWRRSKTSLRAWQKGMTGYPIVDAGMRELWGTGWMHNRVRMIAASFLVKHLLQPWQDGEAWFWDTLVDADIANNTFNWQWVAGSGADASPYFRIFNPVLQGEKFDPQGAYVRRWVPEIAKLPDRYIHKPWAAPKAVVRDAGLSADSYPDPIVGLDEGRSRALHAYKAIKG
ncbi:MAG: deoxyribodipyrimidine photo-lyase [Parvibaculaceae bacterium]